MLFSVVLLKKTTALSKLLPNMFELHLTELNTIFKLFSSFLPAKDSITIRKKIRKVAFIISFWNQFQVWIKLKNCVGYVQQRTCPWFQFMGSNYFQCDNNFQSTETHKMKSFFYIYILWKIKDVGSFEKYFEFPLTAFFQSIFDKHSRGCDITDRLFWAVKAT